MIKIVYIVSTLRKSGPANHLRSLVEHLDRRSFTPVIITLSPEPRNSAEKDFKSLNVEIFSLRLSRAQSFFRAPRMLKEQVRRLSPAIIHTHGIRADFLSAVFLEGYKRVSTIHNFPFEDYALTYGRIPGRIMAKAHIRMLAGIEAPVACSGAISSWLREKQNLQTNFINNGIDASAFRKLPPEEKMNLRKKLKIPPGSLVFVSAGHLNRRKDPLTLLEAFEKSARPGNLLILLGDGNLRPRCARKANNMPHVRIEGRVDNVSEYMQASDVFVSASLSEGFPLSVLEAFSSGLYCVLSDIPPHAEAAGYLPDSSALFPKRDVSALCKTLVGAEELLPDFDSVLSAELAGKIFDASSMSGKYQALYSNLRDKEKILNVEKIKFSVLMCVHRAETPEHLHLCLESINSQELPPDEIVLVKDGRLTPGLEETIRHWRTIFGDKFKPVSLKNNIGFAGALNEGLQHCSFEWVARMDTDDIACPERFREQITFTGKNPGLDVVGAWIEEYDEKMLRKTGCRQVPEMHEDIIKFARWRSPVNHMTVIYRKEAVLASGGYPEELIKMQDYGLWAKLILAGHRFHNIPAPLVRVRAGSPLLARRGGWRYCMNELKLLAYFKRIGFQDSWRLLANGAVRTSVRIMPSALRKAAYKLLRH